MTESRLYGVVKYVTRTVAFVGGGDSGLFAIHSPTVESFPFSLILPSFDPALTHPGDSVVVTDDWCQVGPNERSPYLRVPEAATRVPQLGLISPALSRLLEPDAQEELPQNELTALLEKSLLAENPESLGSLVMTRIGYGQGLTPASDDVVVGLAAGFRALGGFAEHAAAVSSAIRSVPSGQTTDISRALLLAAAGGRFPPALAELCRCLGNVQSAWRPLRRVVRIGGSTGKEMITGLALVVKAHGALLNASRYHVLEGEFALG